MATYGPVSGDSEAALSEILCRCFNISVDRWGVFINRVGRSNLRALQRDDRVAAGLGIYPMGHWFGGKRVPTSGVCTVGVPAESRYFLSTLLSYFVANKKRRHCIPSTLLGTKQVPTHQT